MLHIFRTAQSNPESSRKAELREQRFNGLRDWSTVHACPASSVIIDTPSLEREHRTETDQLQSEATSDEVGKSISSEANAIGECP
jgi:hypothetical protein